MPYQSGGRLPAEKASKLGHLEVLNSELVNKLIERFETVTDEYDLENSYKNFWTDNSNDHSEPLKLIFAVDGSLQTIRSERPPFRELAFIKTAIIRMDPIALEKLDQNYPHPLALRDIMLDTAQYHSTVLPLSRIKIPNKNNYDTIREIIFDSFQDPTLDGHPYETLKWLVYKKWKDDAKEIASISPSFECPHCGEIIKGLPYNSDSYDCDHCQKEVYLTDLIGFHLEMSEDSAPNSVATAYMNIHETLMLFTGIRIFWNNKNYQTLSNSLFIKDGPLRLSSQYSKLVIRIREFLEDAKKINVPIHIMGQEKSGKFYDHLELVKLHSPDEFSYSILSNEYIDKEILHKDTRKDPYGQRVNYGNKIFVKLDKYHASVISIPVGNYKDTEDIDDFIGAKRILATLPKIISYKHEGAFLPIQLAHGVASLSNYPSAKVLKIFSERLLS